MRRLSIILFSLIILSQFCFAGRYYDARTGRFLQIDPLAKKYPSLSPYVYCADNPLKYIDPDGRKLEKVNTPKNKQTILVDSKISSKVSELFKWAEGKSIPVKINYAFRTTEEQTRIQKEFATTKPEVSVAEPGTSRHESGFALDVETVKWTKEQKTEFETKAKELGIDPNQVEKEPWHYEADPTKNGYDSKKAAIDENQKDYERIKKEDEKKNEKKDEDKK